MKTILAIATIVGLGLGLILPVHPAAAAAVAPAAGSDPEVLIVNGRGTLTLSPAAAATYQEYFRNGCPLVLAAHESGRWVTMAAGPDENCDISRIDLRRYIYNTLASCEGGVRYGECWVVALGRKIVWEGPIRAQKGKWTPHSDRQFSVILSGNISFPPNGTLFAEVFGLATYRPDGRTADLSFLPQRQFGHCSGTLSVAEKGPSPFTVTCTKAGAVSGLFDLNADRRTGTGAGILTNAAGRKGARDFDLTVLPHLEFTAKK
jgi:hypothetical protein